MSSSPAEYSTMGQIVLDLTSVAYQPVTKSRERSGHPKRHVTFATSERRPAYPAHSLDMCNRITALSLVMEMTNLLYSPASRKKNLRKNGVTILMTVILHECEEVKDGQQGKTQLPHWNKRCQGTRVSEQRMSRFWAEKQKVKLSVTISTSCLTSAT